MGGLAEAGEDGGGPDAVGEAVVGFALISGLS